MGDSQAVTVEQNVSGAFLLWSVTSEQNLLCKHTEFGNESKGYASSQNRIISLVKPW
jgi:hypothetical protein